MAEVSVVVLLEQARRNREQAQRARRSAASATHGLIERLESCAREMDARADELEKRARELADMSRRSRSLTAEIARLTRRVRDLSFEITQRSVSDRPRGTLDAKPMARLLLQMYREAAKARARAEAALEERRRNGDENGAAFWLEVVQALAELDVPMTAPR